MPNGNPDAAQPLDFGCNNLLGPLPEPDMSHEKARDDRDEETSYSAESMEAERQRCYAMGMAAERARWRALLEARAAGCERAAENTEDPKFDAMARVLMSVREDGSRA